MSYNAPSVAKLAVKRSMDFGRLWRYCDFAIGHKFECMA